MTEKHCSGPCLCLLLLLLGVLSSCLSGLHRAKIHYVQGTEQARNYQTGAAVSSFKRARLEASSVIGRGGDAQAYLVKGLAELKLDMWSAAEASFRMAFHLGVTQAEDWAGDVALFGAANSLEHIGLTGSAQRIYAYILNRCRLTPVLMPAAERMVAQVLKDVSAAGDEIRTGRLKALQKRLDTLIARDMACGTFHYLASQVAAHMGDFEGSFEEAILAKELGLSSRESDRDNDLQIIFCYDQLVKSRTGAALEEFRNAYETWTRGWNWSGPRTPDWKREDERDR